MGLTWIVEGRRSSTRVGQWLGWSKVRAYKLVKIANGPATGGQRKLLHLARNGGEVEVVEESSRNAGD